jgi:ATP-dependent Clp protease ATP-binding subunit ClpA/ActR/RegA family two-component response regulator
VQPAAQTDTNIDLLNYFSRNIVGQPGAAERIVPFIQTYRAGLTPENRPIGVFLLLGPTGTGKTRTVEVLAEALHGSPQHYLRIDCGEFQLDHEVAKLIGAPPGYLGHRETVPVLSQQKLAEAVSPECDISLVLLDEIEKAAPSLGRLLLGVLDKARLTLGDNSVVTFEKSLIFLTSNLGAREMMREMAPTFGFEKLSDPQERVEDAASKLEGIALTAMKKMFSPEFVNRIDAVITYRPLSEETIKQILDHQIEELQQHVNGRLGSRCFTIELTESAREFLLGRGVSVEYGARELKRVIYRHLTQPLATLVAENQIAAGSCVTVQASATGEKLDFQIGKFPAPAPGKTKPSVLIVDDNEDLLKFLKLVMKNQDWDLFATSSGKEALSIAEERDLNVALVDYMIPDLDGLAVAKKLQQRRPGIKIILMTGGGEMMPGEHTGLGRDVPIVQKPFLVDDLLNLIRSRIGARSLEAASGGSL